MSSPDNIESAFDYAKPVSDISETGFGFSSFLHSIGETETSFTSETIETWSGDGFANETGTCACVYVELSVVIVAEITTKSNIHIFYKKYVKVL